MPRPCGHRLPQLARPAAQHHRTAARPRHAGIQIAAIGGQRRRHALAQHPVQHGAGIGSEMELQQLLPHLLLLAAQIDDVRRDHARHRQQGDAEGQQPVDGLHHPVAEADHVAEIDQPVAGAESLTDGVMDQIQPVGLRMDGANGPDAARPAERGETAAILDGADDARGMTAGLTVGKSKARRQTQTGFPSTSVAKSFRRRLPEGGGSLGVSCHGNKGEKRDGRAA